MKSDKRDYVRDAVDGAVYTATTRKMNWGVMSEVDEGMSARVHDAVTSPLSIPVYRIVERVLRPR